MGNSIIRVNPNVGHFGQKAALNYQALQPIYKSSTTLQYTPDINAKGASHDLFAYAQTFAKNPNDFATEEIKAASGLDVHQLSKPDTLKTLWDTDKNGKVDLKEAFVGLAHLDSADGAFDGKITQEGRQEIARLFFDEGVKQRIMSLDHQQGKITQRSSGEGLNIIASDLSTDALAIAPESNADFNLLADQTGLYAKALYPNHVYQQIHAAQAEYTKILSQVGQALDITERFHGYQCACCPAQ